MRFKWIVCALAAFMLASAQAAEAQYISPEDSIYWHANASCQGEFMLEADSTKDLFPCPVCVQEDVKPEVTAVERGGTIILRMPDSWANSRTGIHGIFGASNAERYEGEEAVRMAGHFLHGDEYNAFMKSWQETGKAEDWIWVPQIYPENNEFFMNERHIGGAWYVTMRPDRVSGDSIRMYLRFFCGMMRADGDRLTAAIWDDEWGDDNYILKFSKKQNKSSTFSRDYGDFSIDIYDELDTHIAVVRWKNADKDLLKEVRLTVGDQPDIILNGYMSGADGVFCGTLTDGEDHLIRTGAPVKLWHEPWYTEEDFRGTDYAVVKKGAAGYGLIDRDGNFVYGPGYDAFIRSGNTVFFLLSYDKWEVLNLDTMAQIAEFDYGNGIGIFPLNSAVFAVATGDMWYIHDNETGQRFAAMNKNDEDAPRYTGSKDINGKYTHYEIGKPRRLVFSRKGNDEETYMWLADNYGNRLSGNYPNIEPLVWNGDKGVFAVYRYSDDPESGNDRESVGVYDGQSLYPEEDWRVGIMDETGSIIASVDYGYAEVVSETEVRLRTWDEILVKTVHLG